MSHTINWHIFGTVLTEEDGYNGNMRGLQFSAKNLTEIRKGLGLTQKDIAEGSGVAYVTIQHLEQARLKNPTYEVVTSISRFLSEKAGYKIVFWLDHELDSKDELIIEESNN